MELHEAVVCLAHWRKRTEDAQAKVRDMMNALMESPEYKAAAQESVDAHQMMCETEDTVRRLAVDFYNATGDTQAHDVVAIKLYTELRYEPLAALEYCREHLQQALKLDTKLFERIAKVAALDFVEIEQAPRATIASDLSEYL